MRTKHREIKIVLLLDGAEHLISGVSNTNNSVPCVYEFLAAIHNISQRHGFLVSIMVFTSPEIPRRNARGSRSIPEPRYDRKIFLSSLSEDGCNQMINAIGAQMGLIYTEESLSRLYYETGGHPYVTRQVCSLIAKNLKHSNSQQWTLDAADQATVQVRDVEQAVSDYIEYKTHYLESVWRQLSRVEQEILRIITTKHSCTFDDFITAEYSRTVTRARREAISVLVKNDLIEKCENKYSIKMGLFERLILANN